MAEENKEIKSEIKKKEPSILQPANKNGRHINPMLVFLRILIIPFALLLFPLKFIGNRKVKDGACLYVANHYRLWDVVAIAMTTWEGIHFVGKSSLARSWIASFCRAVKVIFVDRDGTDVKGVMDMMKCLKNNEKVAIYPEGTRNKTKEELLPFHSGAAIVAIKTKTPIIPVVLYKKTMPFRLNHVLIGEPFEMSEYYGVKMTPELIEEADNKLRDLMLKMKADHKEELENKKKKKRKEN